MDWSENTWPNNPAARIITRVGKCPAPIIGKRSFLKATGYHRKRLTREEAFHYWALILLWLFLERFPRIPCDQMPIEEILNKVHASNCVCDRWIWMSPKRTSSSSWLWSNGLLSPLFMLVSRVGSKGDRRSKIPREGGTLKHSNLTNHDVWTI